MKSGKSCTLNWPVSDRSTPRSAYYKTIAHAFLMLPVGRRYIHVHTATYIIIYARLPNFARLSSYSLDVA